GGFGIRLDVGNAYAGAVVSPYFDSLLVKASVHAPNFTAAVAKMQRALHEFQITGVKTNVAFLEHLLATETFRTGEAETAFIDAHPELLQVQAKPDTASRLLWYISDVTVNGFKGVERQAQKYYPELRYDVHFPAAKPQKDLVALLHSDGAQGVTDWIKAQNQLLLTDTTFRDAHQSLFATRMRTRDMLTVAQDMGNGLPNLFSMEVWGGATFDVAYRFLNEDPWTRLKKLRAALPHTLLQMLFRGSNAVGYQNYPDNVIKAFIQKAADDGVDVFRIFDSLNWLPQMTLSIDTVKQTGKLAEATMCYTGDILSHAHPKYQLAYYVDLAKQLVAAGADMLAIKDMAGLLKPQAATELV
ncbi:MAG: pyruvate carboxylase, partial [Lacticaseibacillus paracasei]